MENVQRSGGASVKDTATGSSAPSPVELLQQLIRFDTTNPPGNERACIQHLDELLRAAGCETRMRALDNNRPNLIARIAGSGAAPPLLLYGHVDVVTTENQRWTYPPFEGRIAHGHVWGRGTLDMKGGVAMMTTALLRLKQEGRVPKGDIVLAILSDEEAGGIYGAEFLVERHRDIFENIRYAIGEFGGFTFHVGRKRFYPIQVAEKQSCRLRAIVRGDGGHSSLVVRNGTMGRLGELLRKLDATRLPVHIIPSVREMLRTMSSALGYPSGAVIRLLAVPSMTDRIVNILGERGAVFDPLLHNTVNATIVRGGDKINVVPSEVEVEFDARLLPGFGPEDLIAEIRQIIGDAVELEVSDFVPGPAEVDLALFPQLASILKEADPDGVPIPYLLPAVTDARHLSRLGIQTYGFLPMPFPADLNFSRLIHAADERVPVDALEFGSAALLKLLERYGTPG